MIIISSFLFNFINFCVIVSFFWYFILTALVVAKLVILCISPLTSFILALREALVAKLVILSISPVASFILALREAFQFFCSEFTWLI